MGRGLALAFLLFAACGYQRGASTISTVRPAARAQLGCLDVGVALHDRTSPRAPTLRVGIGNACDHRIRVDLSAIRAEGRDHAGRRIALAARPARWLRERDLGARWHARELISYEATVSEAPRLREVCLDVAPVHRSSITEHWMCLSAGGAR